MTDRLHRIHAAPASGKGGNSLDIGQWRWRADGGDAAEGTKREAARRLAVCWNICEGWPTASLERGVLRDVDDLARELVDEISALGDDAPRELARIAALLRAAFGSRDLSQDLTDGRPADCDGCYPPSAPEDGAP